MSSFHWFEMSFRWCELMQKLCLISRMLNDQYLQINEQMHLENLLNSVYDFQSLRWSLLNSKLPRSISIQSLIFRLRHFKLTIFQFSMGIKCLLSNLTSNFNCFYMCVNDSMHFSSICCCKSWIKAKCKILIFGIKNWKIFMKNADRFVIKQMRICFFLST